MRAKYEANMMDQVLPFTRSLFCLLVLKQTSPSSTYVAYTSRTFDVREMLSFVDRYISRRRSGTLPAQISVSASVGDFPAVSATSVPD